MVLREHKDPLNTSRGIMGPLENSAGVQNNRGRLKQRFDLIRKLGQGTYGKVQLGIDKETGQEVAIKTIKKSKIETEADLIRIRREIQIMSSVRHPNIIHIYEVFENREKMVLVMEYAAGGELYDYLNERKILQDDEARRIFRQIASAVYYCHKNKICHRDLKLENILLDEKSNAKIADFGLSNVFDDVNLLKTFCGSPLYASPEIVKGTPYSGPEVDCWSLGVLLYTLVYGAMPFDGSNFKRLVKQISAGDYYEPKKPAEASPLIRRMLTVDPGKRAKVEDICSHSWTNQGFDSDCLKCAEELAKQTPVRLDVLLTLAPNHNIAQNNASAPMDDLSQADAVGGAAMGGAGESNTDISEPPKKPKMQNDKAEQSKEKGKPEAPAKPKRKTQVKTKSKTSPLLNVIQDVEEEEGELMDVQPCDVGEAVGGVTQGQDDDEGDTLSEISEIQTLAEDVLGPKEKAKGKEKKKEKAATTQSQKTEPAPKEVSKPVKVVESTKKTPPGATTAEPTPPPVAPVPEKAAEETPKVVVKKKVMKPKGAATEEPKKEEGTAAPEAKPTKPEPETKAPAAPAPVEDKKAPQVESTAKTVTPTAAQATPDSSDKEGDSAAENKKKLIRQRSGSVGEVSPTRVERRNSKVISQKTAELIQNLETKTGTSSGGEGSGSEGGKIASRPPGIKKLVIPSFKVSDAKSKFEAKPPRPITSSVISQSKAAFEAKAQQSASKPNLAPEKSVSEAAPKPPPAKTAVSTPAAEIKAEPAAAVKPKPKEDDQPPKVVEEKPKPKEEVKAKETPAAADKKPAASLAPAQEPATTNKSPAASPKVKPKVVKRDEPASEPITKPTVKTQPPVAAAAEQEIKPVMMDTGKGGPKPVTMVVKGRTTPTPTSSPVPPISSPPPTPTPTPVPAAGESPPKNKELAAKKISSVINKIVSSSSNDEKKFVPKPKEGNVTPMVKTEVSFPVVAAQSQERVIPIKFVEEADQPQLPASPPPYSAPPSTTTSRSSVPGSGRFPPSRYDSNKRFDSSSSMYSRQNSASDTESCTSIAPPAKHEPIRKSPREFLIPIKLEASGQTVTPKEEIASEPGTASEDDFRMDSRLRSGRFGKHKRYSSLLSDSSVDEEPSVSISGAIPASNHSRRPSTTASTAGGSAANHARSRSQGDEPETPTSTFKRYRIKRPDLDRSDSFSSAEEDDEDFFEVFTADSLFSNLLDRVRNLTKRINRDGGSMGPNWPGNTNDPMNFGMWNPSSSLRDLMNRAPSETRTFGSSGPGSVSMSTHRSFSREPSVSVTINTSGPGGSSWRRSLSRDVSGDSERNYRDKGGLSTDVFETTTVRSVPLSMGNRRSPSYMSQRSEPAGQSGDLSASSVSSRYGQSSSGASTTPTHQTSSRPAYGRTMSSTDYASVSGPGISRTLPFRRSLKTFDRSNDYSSGSGGGSSYNSNLDSMIGAVKGLGQSLIDSPSTFDPDSYLRQLRSLSRDRDREGSVGRMTSISESEPFSSGVSNSQSINVPLGERGPSLSGELNGWVGGSNISNQSQDDLISFNSSLSSVSQANANNNSSNRLSVQEKMNNYQQYYQSLTSQSPLRRFQLASPSQIHNQNSDSNEMNSTSPNSSFSNSHQIGLARPNSSNTGNPTMRPNTMYETSYVDRAGGSKQVPTSSQNPLSAKLNHQEASGAKILSQGLPQPPQPATPTLSSAPLPPPETNKQLVQQPANISKPSPTLGGIVRQTPTREVPTTTHVVAPPTSSVQEDKRPSSMNQASSIPKWPGVNIQQYRPLSIPSFPEPIIGGGSGTNNASNSPQRPSQLPLSRVASPPPTNNFEPLVVNTALRIPVPPELAQRIQENVAPNANARPMSPVNAQQSSNSPTNNTSPKKREQARATSVERITRFLERKSVPREVTPGPPETRHEKPGPLKTVEVPIDQLSPEKVSTPKLKTKFLQSLERKWEKLTTSSSAKSIPTTHGSEATSAISSKDEIRNYANDSNLLTIHTPGANAPEHREPSEESSLGNEDSKISESVLLRRAVSPEKKPNKKFGSGTVNAMLGKFKKFEDAPVPVGLPPASKIPAGKPPSGPQVSRIGRRVQSVYAGAASDSVLTLPASMRHTSPSSNLNTIQGSSENINSSASMNGYASATSHVEPPGRSQLSPEPDADLIRTAEVAQQKRRSVRLEGRGTSPAPPSSVPTTQPQDSLLSQPLPITPSPGIVQNLVQKPQQRPSSLGVFSTSNSDLSKGGGQSLIPRLNSAGVQLRNSDPIPLSQSPPPVSSNPEPITVKSMSPPQITIHPIGTISPPQEYGSPMSPHSVTDSFDSSSVCSDKNDLAKGSSVLEDEESVSDRILRKSFYSRFNSLDRNKRSASLSAAGAARKGVAPRNYTSGMSGVPTTSTAMRNGNTTKGKDTSSSLPLSLNVRAQSVERTLSPKDPHSSLGRNRALSPDPSCMGTTSFANGSNGTTRPKSPSPHALVINKYNPNPLFKELITDDFKSNVEKKTEYSRRVTSKLSKLLREIESDLNTCSLSTAKDRDRDDEDFSNSEFNTTELDSISSPPGQESNSASHLKITGGARDRLLNRRNHLLGRDTPTTTATQGTQPTSPRQTVYNRQPSLSKVDSNECLNER